MKIKTYVRSGWGCCLAKWILTVHGQCFLHVVMLMTWQLG